MKPLPRSFFERHPRVVARALLGKLLVRNSALIVARIVETEAYLGADDAAAHAAAGKTLRNAVLFGPAGHAYVYFTYGMHYCLNVSCEREGKAGCVLFRAAEPIAGAELMARNRKLDDLTPATTLRLLAGPARLCQAFAITRDRDNGTDMTDTSASLFLADDGHRVARITASTRIGITKSPDLPLRFYVEGDPFVSKLRA